ncbi:sulfatase-like hydrolase/transferase [Phytohabitans flavus]|uniref:N-acetylgalactosamine-6-sulfatase n=1 Tax=Phytohabitans flavus TaxID=1076124 RepID=A0A6F8XLB9_9ACTN|nr:sulfatase-like hydrolase/transferase [Phytohabitans flavus]BCB74606.1 N-acetylgalactosamine-6-sulfatase [Phytohabitans flavus]
MDSSHAASFTRRGLLGAAAGAAAGATVLPGWAPANEAQETEFRPRERGPAPERPNILVILADDLGWADLSSYGAPDLKTPNIDRLALSGIRFTQGYSASPMCSPTRIGLYTGRYPGRLPGGLAEPIERPSELNGIPIGHPTLASLLKDRGYRTRMFGKWHCGFLPWFSPTRLGWDEFFGSFHGEMDYFSKINTNGEYDLYENEVSVQDLRYYTDIVTEKTVDFISERHSEPWLANVNFTTPHCPWEGPNDQETSKELTARLLAGEVGFPGPLFHLDGGNREKYAEMVESLDAAVGKILRALERTGRRRDTVILFTSDNGGERFSYLWPLAGLKGEVREGGIRVPAILSWPAALPSGRVSHTPVITMDFTATFLDLAGARPHPDYPLDGRSLAGHLVGGQAAPGHDLFWRRRNAHALRRGNLKYFRDPEGRPFLYDLSQDPRECANLARKRPADLAALRAAWEAIDATLLPYPTQ